MRLEPSISGLGKAREAFNRLTGPQLRQAQAEALNDTGFHIRRVMSNEIRSVFDRPTPYVANSVYVLKATPARLVVTIGPTYYGGKGIDPQQILQAQEFGGTRRDKRSEVALRRIGVLPAGFQTTIPDTPYPGSEDGRGNLRGAFLVQLLSYFSAFGEQGYRANLTDRRRAGVHRGTKTIAGRRYFVAYGRLRGGRTRHLAPGIWAASGTQGFDVRPVLLFVRTPNYRSLLSMPTVARKADADEYLQRRMRYRIRKIAGE